MTGIYIDENMNGLRETYMGMSKEELVEILVMNQTCENFTPDVTSTSVTTCVYCRREKWEHELNADSVSK